MEERSVCPYCGEFIAKMAKKCRYCGEWLNGANESVQKGEYLPTVSTSQVESVRNQSLEPIVASPKATVILKSAGSNKLDVVQIVNAHTDLELMEAKELVEAVPCVIKKDLSLPDAERLKNLLEGVGAEASLVPIRNNSYPTLEETKESVQVTAIPIDTAQASQQTFQQPQIVVNVVNNQSVEQNVAQEQTVVINQQSSSEDSAPGWILGEMLAIGGFTWGFTGSWIYGLVAWIGGTILLFIPYLGAVLCWVLGIAWGVLLGVLCYVIFHSEPAAWVVGIIAALSIGYGHYEARQKNMDELDND